MYKESAELLKLIRNESNNSSKTRKIIYSLLIETLTRWGNDKSIVEKDYNEAINKYKEALNFFIEICNKNEYDTKLIIKFANTLLKFIKNIPKINFPEGKKYFGDIINKYYKYIINSNNCDYIIDRYKHFYNIDLDESSFSNVFIQKNEIADIDSYENGNITNIAADFIYFENCIGDNFKASKDDLNDKKVWNFITIGQHVYFKVGANKKGLYASDIIPVKC